MYRQRNLIERFFNKLKHFRRIATRYDKTARNFLAAVMLAATRLWARFKSTTEITVRFDRDLISLFEHDLFRKPVPTFLDHAYWHSARVT